MKKFSLVLVLFLLSFSISALPKKDRGVLLNNTPEKLQTFLNTHFKGVETTYIEKERNYYDVYLKNGYNLEFDKNGDWVGIDCNDNEIPQSILELLPSKIKEYISDNHNNRKIKSVEQKNNGFKGYKIEFRGRPELEIYFDKDGNFKKYDS